MPSERIQRRIDSLLDQAEEAANRKEWVASSEFAREALALDSDDADARVLLQAAEHMLGVETRDPVAPTVSLASAPSAELPKAFVGGRYQVRKFLGEGGKKRVYLAHDQTLDRDVAFALIKTEGLDATGRERIVREAQAMGRMGSHPHVVTIFEIGEEAGAPYVVTELLGGGDVEGLLEKAEGKLPLERALSIAKDVCDGLVFAHSQGIVHRDLKPGNVWLSAESVAKIGDFGLAVNLGRSRLTQHGLMVGTVAYMPPEQALGGEPTPQSDLYSLGAMLYELVTGKPPFQADDPTALISQHINTPPVAPSWNSEHCPPDLEALILRLLAKVPADRPASAGEVLAALERLDPEAKSTSHSDSQANPLDRLARGVFVGRERELERLRSAFDDAFAGHGSVVMLVGEPGIGKTRTVQELETYARMRGAQVYWGRADESAGAPPYRPWRQVAQSYRSQNSDETRRKEWGDNAVELQRIFPALRDLFPNLPLPPDAESEEGQYRLFEAMAEFVRGVSERVPLLIVLDDLHWSDRATLQMLTHLARKLGRSRILVLGTYRDTDVNRTHPLSAALAELNRQQLFTRVPLRGLDRDAVAHYIAATAHAEPPARLVDRIFEETEGNPFFLSEVVNLMAQEGTLGRASNASALDIAIPEGVKEALGRRLDRLSPEANELLSVAAVLGRDFAHTQLVVASGKVDDEVLHLTEEALAARVIEEAGPVGEYRFTHALMQETLLSELSAARRVRLHGKIGEALHALYKDASEARAPELARHFFESSVLNRDHARAAAMYSRLAAEQAGAALAYDQAAIHYERCLELIEAAADSLGEDVVTLWTELAICRLLLGERARGWDACEHALAATSDAHRRARVLVRWGAYSQQGAVALRRSVLEQTLSALGDEATPEACDLLALLAYADPTSGGDETASAADEMASKLGLTGAEYPTVLRLRPVQAAISRGDFANALEEAEKVDRHAIALWSNERVSLERMALAALCAGDIDSATGVLERLVERARALGDRDREQFATAVLARIAWQRGASPPSELFSGEQTVITAPLFASRTALERGDTELAARLLPSDADEQYFGPTAGVRAVVLLVRGDRTAAGRELGRALERFANASVDTQGISTLAAAGDALCALADTTTLEGVAEYLARYPTMRYWTLRKRPRLPSRQHRTQTRSCGAGTGSLPNRARLGTRARRALRAV